MLKLPVTMQGRPEARGVLVMTSSILDISSFEFLEGVVPESGEVTVAISGAGDRNFDGFIDDGGAAHDDG